jgi:hypothetical protein
VLASELTETLVAVQVQFGGRTSCAVNVAMEHMLEAAEGGRAAGPIAAQGADAQARRANTQRRHALAKSAWLPSGLPAWLNHRHHEQSNSINAGQLNPLRIRDPCGPTCTASTALAGAYAAR